MAKVKRFSFGRTQKQVDLFDSYQEDFERIQQLIKNEDEKRLIVSAYVESANKILESSKEDPIKDLDKNINYLLNKNENEGRFSDLNVEPVARETILQLLSMVQDVQKNAGDYLKENTKQRLTSYFRKSLLSNAIGYFIKFQANAYNEDKNCEPDTSFCWLVSVGLNPEEYGFGPKINDQEILDCCIIITNLLVQYVEVLEEKIADLQKIKQSSELKKERMDDLQRQLKMANHNLDYMFENYSQYLEKQRLPEKAVSHSERVAASKKQKEESSCMIL